MEADKPALRAAALHEDALRVPVVARALSRPQSNGIFIP